MTWCWAVPCLTQRFSAINPGLFSTKRQYFTPVSTLRLPQTRDDGAGQSPLDQRMAKQEHQQEGTCKSPLILLLFVVSQTQRMGLGFLGARFSDNVGLTVELNDLEGLFQPKRFCVTMMLSCSTGTQSWLKLFYGCTTKPWL